MNLHRNLASSARWHGRRVGEARHNGCDSAASYETAHWRYMVGHYSKLEQDQAWPIFYAAERAAQSGAR